MDEKSAKKLAESVEKLKAADELVARYVMAHGAEAESELRPAIDRLHDGLNGLIRVAADCGAIA